MSLQVLDQSVSCHDPIVLVTEDQRLLPGH
jgi:hypothetical protein